ncbi:MAG TPA: purine-nucleoside phosphorylase [Actinomycetaceae bacterium]|nr:purine-nucleoside phosphorylase [Actinomycetaceae bacterium]
MATPHIAAEPGDFAPAVLMPGDPKRAERIAHQLMDDARLVNDVRGMLGFTGTHQGRPLSVMGSGMGQPSATIYVTELFRFFGVERVIRVGTTGGIASHVRVGDVIVATGAHTDSSMNQRRIPGINFSAVASFQLAAAAMAAPAAQGNDRIHVGTIVSKDHFYFAGPGETEALARYGVLGVDMEAAAMYGVAAEFGKQALTVLTVSDHLMDHSSDMTAEERETRFSLALELAVAAALG